MSEAAVSTLEQLDSNLRDIDAVLDLVSVTPLLQKPAYILVRFHDSSTCRERLPSIVRKLSLLSVHIIDAHPALLTG